MSSASCAPPSWWRTPTWRQWRRSWRTPSGCTTRRARDSSPPRRSGASLVRKQTYIAFQFSCWFHTGELLAPLTDEELEGIIEELDEVTFHKIVPVFILLWLTLTLKCLSSSQQIAQILSVLCRTALAQWTLMSSARWWWPSRRTRERKKANRTFRPWLKTITSQPSWFIKQLFD